MEKAKDNIYEPTGEEYVVAGVTPKAFVWRKPNRLVVGNEFYASRTNLVRVTEVTPVSCGRETKITWEGGSRVFVNSNEFLATKI